MKALRKELTHEHQLKNEAVKLVEESADEVTSLKVRLQVEKDLVMALKVKIGDKKESNKQEKVIKIIEQASVVEVEKETEMIEEEGPLSKEKSKCGQCNFTSSNRIILSEHKEKRHKQHKCLMCGETSPNLDSYRKHKKKHQEELNVGSTKEYPGNVYNFKCTPCDMSFRTNENLMDHMYNVHLTESQRRGDGLKKYYTDSGVKESKNKLPTCTNGNECRFHRQGRCMFFHALPPQEKQFRHPRQAPNNDWQQMQSRRPHHPQGNGVHKTHQKQTLNRGNMGGQRTNTTWCKHVHNCLQGRFCVLRKEADQDFSDLQTQRRQ